MTFIHRLMTSMHRVLTNFRGGQYTGFPHQRTFDDDKLPRYRLVKSHQNVKASFTTCRDLGIDMNNYLSAYEIGILKALIKREIREYENEESQQCKEYVVELEDILKALDK